MSVVFWRKHSYTLLWSCIAVLMSLVLLCQLIGGLLTSRHHYVQARYAYQLLVLLPFQRAASQVRLGDTYYASHDYANATSWYEKSITSLNSNTRCTVYTKIGDSNANQALQENEKENRARLFRAASDSYQLCLNIDSKYGVATEHKAKVDQELANDEQVTKQLNQTNTTNSGVNNIESTDSTLQLEW